MNDTYAKVEINGLNAAQGLGVARAVNDLDRTGVTIVMPEWSADDNITRISFGGPDPSAFMALINSEILSRLGRLPDVSVSVSRASSRVKTRADARTR